MNFTLSFLVADEALFVQILVAFTETICVPICRNGAELGLQNKTTEIFANLNKLCELHTSLHADLENVANDDLNDINKLFEKYTDQLNKVDVRLMEQMYECIAEIFELSYDDNIMNMIRKLNFEHNFNDINISKSQYYKEEPQFIAYMLYFGLRMHKYVNYYNISCLTQNKGLYKKCTQLYHEIDSALYLLCLETQITQSQIKLFVKNRVLIRLEKLNMEAGKFKKKQKKRLLIMFSDRIMWCSIIANNTKYKYKYKGSYKIKDDNFEIKPFVYDNLEKKHFGFKFGLKQNEKSFKIIVCSENQQSVWCKDINKYIVAPNNMHMRIKSVINVQTIDILESFLKSTLKWNRDKIWHKIFDTKHSDKSLLSMILSLFYDLLSPAMARMPPPITINTMDETVSVQSNREASMTTASSSSSSSTSLSDTDSDSDTDASIISVNEINQLKQEVEQFKIQYKILQNENAKLSARNTFLNDRLIALSNKILSSAHNSRNRSNRSNRNNTTDSNHEDGDDDDDAAKYMNMISHTRKNSDSTLLNKSPSFLSTLKDDTHIDKIDIAQPSKSRHEMVYRHKKKPKKKSKHRKIRKTRKNPKITHRSKTLAQQDDDSTHSSKSNY